MSERFDIQGGMRRLRLWALAGVLALIAGAAAADCVHKGRTFPEGARIGGLVCENGKWVAR